MDGPFETNQPGPRRRDLLNQLWTREAGGITASSTDTITIATGLITLDVGENRQFAPGQPVRIALRTDPAGTWMDGTVTGYEDATLTVDVASTSGSGTYADWSVSLVGPRGEAIVSVQTVGDLPDSAEPGAVMWALDDGWYRKAGPAGSPGWERIADQPASEEDLNERMLRWPLINPNRSVIAFSNDRKRVLLWHERGMIAGMGMTSQLRRSATKDVAGQVRPRHGRYPLIFGGGRVYALWNGNGFDVPALSDALKAKIRAVVGPDSGFAPAVADTDAHIPTATDGRSLFRLRARLADIAAGVPALLQIGFTGDSWTEYLPIIEQMRALLDSKGYSSAGEGWLSVNTANKPSGITLTRSTGWTFRDGSSTGQTFPYGAGPDGFSLHADRDDQTATLAGVRATRLRIFYWQTAGTFRWRVDGGSWTSVTGDGSNTLGIVTISGLADTAHTLDIDTQGNTDVASLTGFDARHADAGYVVHKMGNAGLRGQHMLQFTQFMEPYAQALDIDVLQVILGTNDKTNAGSPPSVYVQAMTELEAAYRTATPDIGLIFTVPADSQGTVVTPLPEYRDALYRWCVSAPGRELFNMYDQFGSYVQANALGQWLDGNHLNGRGARNLVRGTDTHLLHL